MLRVWGAGLIPLSVKVIFGDAHWCQFRVGCFGSRWILFLIQCRMDLQASGRRRTADQVHHHGTTCQRSATPVAGDVAEHPVFDLVPLARPPREMTHPYPQPHPIPHSFHPPLPQPPPIPPPPGGTAESVTPRGPPVGCRPPPGRGAGGDATPPPGGDCGSGHRRTPPAAGESPCHAPARRPRELPWGRPRWPPSPTQP